MTFRHGRSFFSCSVRRTFGESALWISRNRHMKFILNIEWLWFLMCISLWVFIDWHYGCSKIFIASPECLEGEWAPEHDSCGTKYTESKLIERRCWLGCVWQHRIIGTILNLLPFRFIESITIFDVVCRRHTVHFVFTMITVCLCVNRSVRTHTNNQCLLFDFIKSSCLIVYIIIFIEYMYNETRA